MSSPFFETVTELLLARKIAVTRFEFEYMAARRTGLPRKPPPRAETLTGEYRDLVSSRPRQPKANGLPLIGGKSMGGRVASLVADTLYADGTIGGLVCLGYPFHPPGKPEQLRTAHLKAMQCPALIVQGERDPFGNRAEVESLTLSPTIELVWLGEGDHDFGPRGRSGFTRKGNLTEAADAVAAFAARLPEPR